MRSPIRLSLIFLVLFLAILLGGFTILSFSGLANQHTGATLDYGTYYYGTTYLPVGGLISYSLEVTSGDPVDVYIIPDDQIRKFINHEQFSYIESASFTDANQAEVSTWIGAGWYHIVVLTNGYSSSSISMDLHGGPTIGHLLIVPIISLIVSAVVVLVIRRRRRLKREAERSSQEISSQSSIPEMKD